MGDLWTPEHAFWSGRPVGVTGGTGFLGSHLVERLVAAGAEVVVLVRDEVPPTTVVLGWKDQVTRVRGAVEDRDVMARLVGEYGLKTVFHLAAQSQVGTANRDPVSTFEANITGTWSVLEACRGGGTVEQVVVASSDKAYGDQPVLPYTEDMTLNAVNPYDVSKACAEMITRSYARAFDLPVTVTRCGNIFGPGDTNWNRLIPGVARDLLLGRRPVIRSDGRATRDYLYVKDAAQAYMVLAEAMSGRPELVGEAFNFSDEKQLSVLELVAMIRHAAGSDLEPDVKGVATNEIAHQSLSAAKARNVLGWKAAYSLEEALAETVAWYRQELAARP